TSAPDSAQQRTDTSAQAPLADQATAPTATPVIQPASLESMTAGWDSLLKHIGEHKKSLEGTLGRGRPMGYVDGVLSVGLPKITSWDERTLAQEQAALIGLVGQFFDGISEITLIEQGTGAGTGNTPPRISENVHTTTTTARADRHRGSSDQQRADNRSAQNRAQSENYRRIGEN
ncbi:MAG: hypothetical protein QGH20_10840, partial [Candidatus Latescibacteria bacterium]|nr:hypothetical protein [Candidatus Latescibacterota bacterium]